MDTYDSPYELYRNARNGDEIQTHEDYYIACMGINLQSRLSDKLLQRLTDDQILSFASHLLENHELTSRKINLRDTETIQLLSEETLEDIGDVELSVYLRDFYGDENINVEPLLS